MARVLPLLVVAAPLGVSSVAAEPLEVGGLLGPRLFSDDSILGSGGDADTSLRNSVVLGGRVSRQLRPWLVPEFELGLAPTSTRAQRIDVLWFEPRVQVRFQFRPAARLRPFAVVGGGMPVVLSNRRSQYASSLTGEGYAGGGVGWSPGRGLSLRLDARLAVQAARGDGLPVAFEGEITAGVWFELGKAGKRRDGGDDPDRRPEVADRDHDGVRDQLDQCPDRAEDRDGFADDDGCPDIDNDVDQVLDVADKCPTDPELYNGFEDQDGCPDTIPPDVDGIIGTIARLTYRFGDIAVRSGARRSLDQIAAVMAAHPSLRLILVGHTDSREARPRRGQVGPDGEPPDPAEAARALGLTRAAAVRDALVERGVARGRFQVASAGAEQPLSESNSRRARLRNRRVEVRLFVPRR